MEFDVVTIATDAIRGRGSKEFSTAERSDALRNAFVEMNGGSTKINPKNFYRGNALFELVQEIIPVIIDEGIKNDNTLMKLVEYRNIADGDEAEFDTQGKANFVVRDAAAGIMGVRRQRIEDGDSVPIKTTVHTVRVYDGLNRFLAGRVDFNTFVQGVADAFKKQIAEDAYACLNGITAATAGLNATYVQTGSFDEGKLIALIQHVEAATGKIATIYGTKAALRKVTTATVSTEAKSDMYNFGFYGRFNGTNMVEMKQAHKAGTDTFALDDTKLWIVASDEKPVKVVNEGDGILNTKEATENADLTQEYVYIQAYGTGVICGDKLGLYTVNA